MRIFYDTEFLEDGKTIELISIGMVAEDGREYYAVNSALAHRWGPGRRLRRRIQKHEWLMANVVPGLPKPSGDWNNHMPQSWLFNYLDPAVKSRERIAQEIRDFVLGTDPDQLPYVELWAWYGAYDHVALSQLFGRMIDLPEGMPMWTNDLRQEAERLGAAKLLPEQPGGVHNALADAQHNLVRAQFLDSITARPA
jgi:hypothetical protein